MRKFLTFLVLVLPLVLGVAACSSAEQKAAAHYESGEKFLNAGDYPKARIEFLNALKYNEKNIDAWLGLALIGEKTQSWAESADAYKHALELNPSLVEARTKLARYQLAGGELDTALSNVNAANDLKKDDSDILALRSAILLRLNDQEGARSDAEKALAINPDNPDAHAILAADQLKSGNTAAALQFADRGLQSDPKNIGLLLLKVKILHDTKDSAKLEATLREITTYYPKLRAVRQGLIYLLASQNRLADVELEMRAMIAEEPDDTSLKLDLAKLAAATKGADAGRSEFEKLVRDNPDVGVYRIALAQFEVFQKKYDAAKAVLDAMIARGEPKEDVVKAQVLLATIRMKLGEDKSASELIDAILTEDAANADALGLRANIKLNAGDIDGAIADLREALNQNPKSIPLMVSMARAQERAGSVDLATDNFGEVVKVSNFDPEVVLEYVAFLERRNNVQAAESILSQAVSRHPRDQKLLTSLARQKLKRQEWASAEEIAASVKKLGDTGGMSDEILGAALLGQGKYEESITLLSDAQATAPDATRPMTNLVAAYIRAGKLSEAEAFLQTALKANERNAEAHVLMGMVKTAEKKPLEAEAAYKLAIKSEPENPAGYAALARQQISDGRLPEAEKTLREGLAKAPANLDLNLGLAGILELNQDFEGAINIYEEQLKANPDSIIIVNNLASTISDHRTDEESLARAYQLAKRLEGFDVPQFQDTLGWIAYRRADYSTAQSNLEAAVAKLPGLALARYHLGMLYLALKRPADAREQFAQAQKLLKADDPLQQQIRTALNDANASN